jgi:putative radical SAM enzyme (TIGR03279 family)
MVVTFEDPGLEFDEVIFDGIRTCANRCEFCYVHQMPKGFRKNLYLMDDDFRTSFLYGSFITLTNLAEADILRILDERLSPLYVSVHSINERLREDMLRWGAKVQDEGATKIQSMLARLAPIDLYTQVVLIPGRNDGVHLAETLEDLSARSNVLAVAVVPVGLTDHRAHLPSLRTYSEGEAAGVVRQVEEFQQRMLRQRGTRFAFLSDEFYLLAGRDLPSGEMYEGFPMLENGVGMVRDFFCEPLPELPHRLPEPKKVLIATGTLFADVLERALEPLDRVEGLELEVRALKNRTFGEQTTVAGLLAGRDFLSQVVPGEADVMLVSPNVLKFGTECLLDDRTLDDLRRELRMEVVVGGSHLAQLGETILDLASRRTHLPQFGYSTHAVKEALGKSKSSRTSRKGVK